MASLQVLWSADVSWIWRALALTEPGIPHGATSGEAVEDRRLLEKVCTRDAMALEALYDRHHQVAMGVAVRLLRNQQLAEDVVQEAFLSVWKQAASFHGERGTVRNWLLSIVHHRAVDSLRRRDVAQPPLALGAMEDTMTDVPDAESPEVWEYAARTIEREHVQAALRALPAEQRATIELAYFRGLTCLEVSERMKVPLGTVKGRMRLALQKLRALLPSEIFTDSTAAPAALSGAKAAGPARRAGMPGALGGAGT